MCTPIPQAQEEHGDITEFILITHEHSYMSRVFMSFFPFMCAFVKKGAAITGKGRNTPKGRMISTCFPPISKQISITCCHLQFKELLKKSHIKVEERRASQVGCFFLLLSPFPCSDISLRPDPPRQFTT